MLANIGALRRRVAVGVAERRRAPAGERCSSTSSGKPARRAARASGAARRRCRTCYNLLARFLGVARGGQRVRRVRARQGPRAGPTSACEADAELVHYVEVQLAGAIGAASARVMVASVVKEEALTLDEVREILDEASQVVVYSHRLEQKSRELEAATAELRAANERLKELDRLKDDFVSTVTPRAAHAAHLDPRVHRDPARQTRTSSPSSARSSSASSPRRPSG